MENGQHIGTPQYKPTSLFQALQGYILWTDRFIERLESVGLLPKEWPKPKDGEIGILVSSIPVPPEAGDFPIIHAIRKERYEFAYKMADSEKTKTDDPRKPIAERWSTLLKAAILRSAIGINTLVAIPDDQIPQTFVHMSYNPKAIDNLHRAVRDLNEFLSVLGVLSREGSKTVLSATYGPTEQDIDACLQRLGLKGDEYLICTSEVFNKRQIRPNNLRVALVAGQVEKHPTKKGKNRETFYKARSVVRRFYPNFTRE